MALSPTGSFMKNLDNLVPAPFQKMSHFSPEISSITWQHGGCSVHAGRTVAKKLTVIVGQSAPVNDTDDVSLADSPERAY